MATTENFISWLRSELQQIRDSGMWKDERVIVSPQGSSVSTLDGEVVNLCANNYLGLADDPEIVQAAVEGLQERGFGMASVRFICGTQDLHKTLEQRIARFLGTEDAILYTSCFDANGGLFETLLGPDDCVISDALNHASIIDGVRLCKAERKIYRHADMADLEQRLREASSKRFRMIATDGVFSMHGDLAPLPEICDLAEKYGALVMVDDSHATGFLGPTGRGTPEYFNVASRIDILTSTLGKAIGGASGGFTTGRAELVALLRQRSRPYLFSNSVAPVIVAGTLKALDIIERHPELVRKLAENTDFFRQEMTAAGFNIQEGVHPIVPIMLGDEKLTVEMARRLNERGIFVVGFSYPVVPRGQARIRVQISASHTREQLERAIRTFVEVANELGLLERRAGKSFR
ncbi:MAG TPA: glycine C-acetyltransferase [Acidobacteriota bacterium]|nr:glycine C-acetyltransferase [Acidobacteriota bacterium]